MNNDVIYPTMVIRSQAETIELQEKEIERLNNIIDKQDKDITTLSKENKKLKNIIDELEKWLKEENYKDEDFWCINSVEVLNKLKELKENNKEIKENHDIIDMYDNIM